MSLWVNYLKVVEYLSTEQVKGINGCKSHCCKGKLLSSSYDLLLSLTVYTEEKKKLASHKTDLCNTTIKAMCSSKGESE